MKTNVFIRSVLLLLLFILSACQPSNNLPTPTAASQPTNIATPTIAPTEPIATGTVVPTATETETTAGQIAYAHVEAISEEIGPRPAGSEAEARTAQYIILEFERLGYLSELRPFTATVKGKTINSANIIAIKHGESPMEIIVGAHYDSVDAGKGADDNASGVGVILEVAERIKEQQTPYTIRFILFGAEEVGLQGSQVYVEQMTAQQIQNTIAMINLDSVAAGDMAYVYGDAGERGVIRDWVLDFAEENGLALQTQLGENPAYPRGTTGDWSDHAPFKSIGIPYTYLESTNWGLGKKDGYTQVSTEYGEDGEIWHTEYDTLEYINTTFPGRVQERLNLFVVVLETILTKFSIAK
jgi:alkaline phosphatase isozyme conversion protein